MSSRRDFMKMGAVLAAGSLGLPGIARAIQPVSRKGTPTIKVGCAAYSYSRYIRANTMTLEGFIDLAAEIGCDGVELTSYYFPPNFDIQYINKIKRQAFLLGLDISATSVGNQFTFPPGPDRDKNIAHVKQWIDHAAEMGAPCMRVFGGPVPKGSSVEEASQWVVECMEECAKSAEQRGVVLALENHGGVTTNADRLLSIMKSVSSDWVGVNLDTGNFVADDPYAAIEKASPYTVTTHIKTQVSPTGKPKEEVDVQRIVNILRKAEYRGYLTVEYEGAEEPKTAVPKLIQAMKGAIG